MGDSMVDARLAWYGKLVAFGLCFVLAFAVAMTGFMLWMALRSGAQAQELEAVALETHAALCTLRADVQRRHDDAVAYLKKHPKGAPALGLSAGDIQESIDSRAATLLALSGLACLK